MKRYGHQLQFISWIKRDGSGTEQLTPECGEFLQEERLKLIRLSISEDTYIAYGFNCYVVKLKDSNKFEFLATEEK